MMEELTSHVDVRGDIDHLYALASAVPHWAEFLPHYRYVRVIEDDSAPSGQLTVAMSAWRGWLPLTWRSHLALRPAERRILFRHVGGGAQGMAVEWQLTEHDGVARAMITHDLTSLAHRLVASPLGHYVLGRQLINPVAGRTLATMKRWVEAGAASPDEAAALSAREAPKWRARLARWSWLPWLAWLGANAVQGRRATTALAVTGQARMTDEPVGARQLHLAALAASFALLVPPAPGTTIAARGRLAPMLGLSLEAAGFALAGWARASLGRYWTGRVALTADQPLVRTGPYRYVRHPLYAGLLAAVLGQALVLGRPRGMAAFALLTAAYRRKVSYEEAALRRHFGEAYDEYAAVVPAFLPRVRAWRR
jgi:protein-S-isoprenylcysteine O-methyltransferase Ste14